MHEHDAPIEQPSPDTEPPDYRPTYDDLPLGLDGQPLRVRLVMPRSRVALPIELQPAQ